MPFHVERALADPALRVRAQVEVNVRPATSLVPAGYLADGGNVFANRGNGFVYGWNVANGSYARDRNSSRSPDQRYHTLTQMRGADASASTT